jgi:hypothetical protein
MSVNKMDAGYTDNRLEKKYGSVCRGNELMFFILSTPIASPP